MITLKPCPYCGGEAKMEALSGGIYSVTCTACDINIAPTMITDTEEEAVEAWNKRADTVHGRWELDYKTHYDEPGRKNRTVKRCSCCGWTNACRYNYCPNCGAKMDGGDRDAAD